MHRLRSHHTAQPKMWAFRQQLLALSFLWLVVTTSSKSTTATTSSTCPSRTVNYITHSLAQQCLASSRVVNVTSSSVGPALASTQNSTTIIPVVIETHDSTLPPSGYFAEPAVPTTDPTSTKQDVQSVESERTVTESSSIEASQPSTSHAPQAAADESPLEEGHFLSFEDWKRENLKKAGQSEHLGSGHAGEPKEVKKRPSLDHDSLDSLGDDAEIDLDFSGFVSDNIEPPPERQQSSAPTVRENQIEVELGRAPRAGVRRKDAGTTCKERFNYASYDCAATILKTNPEAKGASAVLGKNKDSYMLNECSAQNKFLILELCDDISIDTIVLANFEFFSSTFRTFRVSVSDKYPVKVDKWKTLGTFEAHNTRNVQAFLVENPVIWARYLRIEFLSHYGNEYYCPLSLVRVHGTTMLEEYKHDLESLQSDDDDVESQESDGTAEVDALVPEAVDEAILTKVEPVKSDVSVETPHLSEEASSNASGTGSAFVNATQIVSVDAAATTMPTSPANSSATFDSTTMHEEMFQTCESIDSPTSARGASSDQQNSSEQVTAKEEGTLKPTVSTATLTTNKTSVSDARLDKSASRSTSYHSSVPSSAAANTSIVVKSSSSSTVNGTKVPASSTQAPAAAPTMQESFFKSVQKRLQTLESNSSLSLQYIEEQSRALRDAFLKVEQRQMAKTTSFLDYLNTTVLNELRDFRQQYDQLWQSTVIELEMQRERYQQESMAINARLGILADEVIFQKRMSLLQMLLILICLGLVLFSRGSLNSYLEMPLVQSVLARSPSSRWLSISGLDTPSQSPSTSRANSTREARRRQSILKSRRHLPSEDTGNEGVSPTDLYRPPTPVSIGEASDDGRDSTVYEDPQFDPSLIERPSTSPPILLGAESPPETPRPVAEFEDGSIDARMLGSAPRSLGRKPPMLIVEEATPPSKHLTWNLPND
ncbi:UNC-like C-terminal-domain-containing protein [Exophiala viscosa]|uniref:UNC-like C-terminal-domain-containing protein n=1 Tax=Exophiala viscosa TaxID=2486360 RepID=UPI002193320F|nr:UNC-like C-terminal-domain-containing protein [Exophiala viscosa]